MNNTATKDDIHEYTEPQRAYTEKETDKKCPCCGGVMDFNPSNGKLTCPYCGNEEEIKVEDEKFEAQELDFRFAENDEACDWGTATRTVICKACGAQTVYDFNDIASECPYCGSNQIMEQKTDIKVMAPGGVVPFKLDRKEAAGRFQKWIKNLIFCPGEAKKKAKPNAFKGMYLPFWTFDTNTVNHYTGQYGVTRTWRDKDGKTHTKIDWYPTGGTYTEFFDDILISGTERQNRGQLRGIEPFNTKEAVEYKPEYMAGFMAERYTLKVKEAWEKAKDKIDPSIRRGIESQIEHRHHTSHSRVIHVDTSHRNVTYKYLLLPVWISSFKYKGKVYQFMINGQTGKVKGDAPISWLRVAVAILALLAILGLIHTALNADAALVHYAMELENMLMAVI